MDNAAFFKIGYGLYVVTTREGNRDNGMICNTVVQVSTSPLRLAVSISKHNHTHDTVNTTGVMNVNVLAESAPFDLFKRFGFQSGKTVDKFKDFAFTRGANGLAVLERDVNAVFELSVTHYVDLGSHGLFVCDVTDARELSSAETMTYSYYHAHVKPQPAAQAAPAKGEAKKWVCKICGYVYDPEENGGVAFEDLPEDWLCPWCKHPKQDFEPVG